MINFTKSTEEIGEITYYLYTGDRKRGGSSWVFYNKVDTEEYTYDPTWPKAIKDDAAFSGVSFVSRLDGDSVVPMFTTELTTAQEDALDTLFTNHVAPVPV